MKYMMRGESEQMGGYLSFDKMITPIFIKIAFWIGVVGSLIAGIGAIITGLLSEGFGFIQILGGLLVIVIGPLVVRIYCELLIIFFKMHQSINEIKIALSDPPRLVTNREQNIESS